MLRLARNAQPEPLGYMIEVALTTGMRLSEVCALRASAVFDEPALVVKASLGSGEHGYYEKEPKTESGIRTLPLTTRTWSGLQALKKDMLRTLGEFGVAGADPYLFGTWEADSKPYNPNRLGKEFTAFCKMNGFKCTFNDLRHTFATMMIGKGTDIRTVASRTASCRGTAGRTVRRPPRRRLPAPVPSRAPHAIEVGGPRLQGGGMTSRSFSPRDGLAFPVL